MKLKFSKIIAIALLFWAIALTPLYALADNHSESARQAAEKVTKETGVKEQFGKSENGDRLLDNAKAKASENLEQLADEASTSEDLPSSKKLFLKNLNNE